MRSVISDGGLAHTDEASDSRLTNCQGVYLSRALIGRKEKQLVLLDRSTKGESELILLECWSLLPGSIQEEVVRIENIVSQEFENRPMVPVGSGLRDHADVRPRGTPEGRIVKSGLHFELAQRI